jgi:type VI secretion system secreted protein VgrG
MQHQIIAEIEIEDERIEYYSSITIRQQFNAHHEFNIRISYDVLEKVGSFKLSDAQKKIGKLAIIKLMQADNREVAYEFRGLICEISMEQSDNFTSDLLFKGYSPTILLENGPNFRSFHKKNLKAIVQQLTQPLSQASVRVNIKPEYAGSLTYICQYRESTFNFLNRLSADFGEWFYYDGIDVFFGKPTSPTIEITYGEDVHQLQTRLRVLPLTFINYAYVSKNDAFISSKAPPSVDGLDEYARFALQESQKVFAEPVSFPVRPRVESKGDLDGFVKNQKTAIAADLEVLSGSSDNPAICIGAVADVKISRPENNSFTKEDHGKFLITSIEHHLTENGRYYNLFEGISSGIDVIPVKNFTTPIAEPQIATVMDNADPDNLGRIKVQMLWQQESGEITDWVRVMTSDAGSSDKVAKNRGFMFIPEIGDQVLLCFRYNDPDRPFVLGSIYHGKTAGGGGADNNTKSLSTKSGNTIQLYDKKGEECITVKTPSLHTIEMNDKKGEEKITIKTQGKHTIELDDKKGAERININTTGLHVIELDDKKGAESITVKDKKNNTININTAGNIITIIDKNKNKVVMNANDDSINITANASINMDAPSINMTATTISMLAKGAITMNAGGAIEGAAGGMVTFGAGVSTSLVSGVDTVILAGKMLSASGGKSANFGSGAGAKIELQAKGEATFSSSKKMKISSKDSTMLGTDKATFQSKQTVVEGSTKAVIKGSNVDIA